MNNCSTYLLYRHLPDFPFSAPGNGVLLYYFLVKSSYWSRPSQSQKAGRREYVMLDLTLELRLLLRESGYVICDLYIPSKQLNMWVSLFCLQ